MRNATTTSAKSLAVFAMLLFNERDILRMSGALLTYLGDRDRGERSPTICRFLGNDTYGISYVELSNIHRGGARNGDGQFFLDHRQQRILRKIEGREFLGIDQFSFHHDFFCRDRHDLAKTGCSAHQ